MTPPRTVKTHGKVYAKRQVKPNWIVRTFPKEWRWWLAIKLYKIKKAWRTLRGVPAPNYIGKTTYEGPGNALRALRRARTIGEQNNFSPPTREAEPVVVRVEYPWRARPVD